MRFLMWSVILGLLWCGIGHVLSLPRACETTTCYRAQNLVVLEQTRAREVALKRALGMEEIR